MIARLHRGSFPALLIKIAIIFFPRVMTFEGRRERGEREREREMEGEGERGGAV